MPQARSVRLNTWQLCSIRQPSRLSWLFAGQNSGGSTGLQRTRGRRQEHARAWHGVLKSVPLLLAS